MVQRRIFIQRLGLNIIIVCVQVDIFEGKRKIVMDFTFNFSLAFCLISVACVVAQVDDTDDVFLIYYDTEASSISALSSDRNSSYSCPTINLTYSNDLAYDNINNVLYLSGSRLYKLPFDNASAWELVVKLDDGIDYVTFDGKEFLYFITHYNFPGSTPIYRTRTGSTHVARWFTVDYDFIIKSMEVDTVRGYLLFGGYETIQGLKMDGSFTKQTLISDVGCAVYDMCKDVRTNKLYWCCGNNGPIREANMDGTDVRTIAVIIAERANVYSYSITMYADNLYVFATIQRYDKHDMELDYENIYYTTIYKVSINTGSYAEFARLNEGWMWNLPIIAMSRQILVDGMNPDCSEVKKSLSQTTETATAEYIDTESSDEPAKTTRDTNTPLPTTDGNDNSNKVTNPNQFLSKFNLGLIVGGVVVVVVVVSISLTVVTVCKMRHTQASNKNTAPSTVPNTTEKELEQKQTAITTTKTDNTDRYNDPEYQELDAYYEGTYQDTAVPGSAVPGYEIIEIDKKSGEQSDQDNDYIEITRHYYN